MLILSNELAGIINHFDTYDSNWYSHLFVNTFILITEPRCVYCSFYDVKHTASNEINEIFSIPFHNLRMDFFVVVWFVIIFDFLFCDTIGWIIQLIKIFMLKFTFY